MTTGEKWFGLLVLQAALLGGAYAGGRYPEWKKRVAAEEAAHKDYEKLQSDARLTVLTTRARAMLMEAALAVRYGNYGMAFDRVIRAQTAVQNLKLPLQKEFDELSALLIAQKPEVLEKILTIADKIEPPPRLSPPELTAPGKPAAAMAPPPSSATLTAPTTAAAPAGGAAPASPHQVAPGAFTAPTGVASAAPVVPAANPGGPPHGATPDGSIEQSRASLLSAKELLISGSEPAQVIAKIAHAQVLLEEGGHAEFAEQFTVAIKALRAHEETKARTTLDAVLTTLRSL